MEGAAPASSEAGLGACGMKRKSAFTLIEMLVVLGIIMVVAAIMIPALVKGLKRAKLEQALSSVQSALTEARSRALASGQMYAVVFCNASSPLDENGDGAKDGDDTLHWCAVVPVTPGNSEPSPDTMDQKSERIYLPKEVAFQALTYKDPSGNLWNNGWSDGGCPLLDPSMAVNAGSLFMVVFNPLDPEGLVSFVPTGSVHPGAHQQYIALRLSDDAAEYVLLKIKEKSGALSTVLE